MAGGLPGTGDLVRCPHIVQGLVAMVLVRREAGVVAIDEAPPEDPVEHNGDRSDDDDAVVVGIAVPAAIRRKAAQVKDFMR